MDLPELQTIGSQQFAERFALNPGHYAWLLGAGASAAAGIPTGYQMIREFRAKLYARASGVSQREIDMSDPLWEQRIDARLARDSTLPPKGDPSEYSSAFEALFSTAEDRRRYIANQVKKGSPSIGHRVLGALLVSGKAPCVFTTNFDDLIETGATLAAQALPASDRFSVATAAIESAAIAERCLREGDWPLVAKLHGDYRSVELKNIDKELEQQDVGMRKVLTQVCQRFGLIVVGYSGRDASVMDALTEVLRSETPFPGGIYWLCRHENDLLPTVKEFLLNAETAGVNVYVIRGVTFDEFASGLADVIALPRALASHIFNEETRAEVAQVPLSKSWARKTPVLRLSAIPVLEMPKAARRIDLRKSITTREARDLVREAAIRATVAWTGSHLAGFGKDEELLEAFKSAGATLGGQVLLNPAKDSWALGLLYDALVRAVCRGKPLYPRLRVRGHLVGVLPPRANATAEAEQWRKRQLQVLFDAYGGSLCGQVRNLEADFTEGVYLRLDEADGRWWCVFEPTTLIDPRVVDKEGEGGDPTTSSTLKSSLEDWSRERWAQRYNAHWSRIIDAWIAVLTGEDRSGLTAYSLRAEQGVDAAFSLGRKTAWSRPQHDHAYFRVRPR